MNKEFYCLILIIILITILLGVTSNNLIVQRKKVKRLNKLIGKEPHELYTDYVCVQKMQMLRVFAPGFSLQASEEFSPSQILEYGQMGKWEYYLIELR